MFFAFVLFIFSTFAQAEVHFDGVGNGGYTIFCRSNRYEVMDYRTSRVLDHYRGQFWGYKVDLGPESLSVDDKMEIYLARVKSVDGQRADLYRKRYEKWEEEVWIRPNFDFPEVPDPGVVALPASDCVLEIVAYQEKKTEPHTDPAYYYIKKEFWDRMDNDARAGLIFHEIVYREAIDYDHKDAKRTQYYNSMMSSSNPLGVDEYASIMKDIVHMPATWLLDGIEYAIAGIDLDENYFPKSAFPYLDDQLPKYFIEMESTGNSFEVKKDTRIHLHPDGKIKEIKTSWVNAGSLYGPLIADLDEDGYIYQVSPTENNDTEDLGRLGLITTRENDRKYTSHVWIDFDQPIRIQTLTKGRLIPVTPVILGDKGEIFHHLNDSTNDAKPGTPVSYHETGYVKEFIINHDAEILYWDSVREQYFTQSYSYGDRVRYDENGNLTPESTDESMD